PYARMLKRELTIHAFGGNRDYRKQRLAGRQKYFWPLTDQAARAVQAIWDDLSGGESTTLTLEINARRIVFPRFANGVLRSSFWELCGQPLGPPDFLAIASHIRMLILEGIPRLSRSNYNEARRFVLLIDALYDAGIDLIATAVERPELLYIEGTGSFDFERTASRLREMQGPDWGAEK
ncbi:MAG: cell division protein ZapE, partial [Rhodobacteraceae bacterium]|nr:cell division protein ZapE [Paracoccaceae bacterium]